MKEPLKRDSGKRRRFRFRPESTWMIDVPVKGSEKTGLVRFGSVEIRAARPARAEVERNIEQGRAALARATATLTRPGVKLKRTKGIALYAIDPERPDQLIRTIDGRSDRGVFENGQFKVIG
jgi:hypothetical protein